MSEEPGVLDSEFVPDYEALAEHEKRVVEEKAELSQKLNKLSEFIDENPLFKSLSNAEQLLLRKQMLWMTNYYDILEERINLFFVKQRNNGEIPKYYNALRLPGDSVIGVFGTENWGVFVLKTLASKFIDEASKRGSDRKRVERSADLMLDAQMNAVKSMF